MRMHLLAAPLIALAVTRPTAGQTTAFAYQDQLKDAGNNATGTYDFQFLLLDTSGVPQSTPLTRSGVGVSSGLFTVQLDFGAAFSAGDRLLRIAVKHPSDSNFKSARA